MNILITGHTSPIGSVLYEHLSIDHKVKGISRSTGYDLNSNIEKITKLSLDYECVINLANVGTTQTKLLYAINKLWRENKKNGKIISFGSLITEVNFKLIENIDADYNMIASKLLLEKCHKEISSMQPFGPQPYSVLIRFANYGKKQGFRSTEPYTKPEQIIQLIDEILYSNLYMSTIDFREI
jgi:hypothetical protein